MKISINLKSNQHVSVIFMMALMILSSCSNSQPQTSPKVTSQSETLLAGVSRLLLENNPNSKSEFFKYYQRDYYDNIVELYHEVFVDTAVFKDGNKGSFYDTENVLGLRDARNNNAEKFKSTEQKLRKAPLQDLKWQSSFNLFLGNFDADDLKFKNQYSVISYGGFGFPLDKASVMFGQLSLSVNFINPIVIKEFAVSAEHAKKLYEDNTVDLVFTYDLIYRDNKPKASPTKLEVRFHDTETVIASFTQF